MGGPVSSLGEEVWKDSTADGGHGDEQEWWEVKVLRRRPANSRKFELWLFYRFNFYYTDCILQILILILQILLLVYRFYFAVLILQILFYFTDFILQFLFYRFYFTLQISFSILQTLFYSFLFFYFTDFIVSSTDFYFYFTDLFFILQILFYRF